MASKKPCEQMTFDEFMERDETRRYYPYASKYFYVHGFEDPIGVPWVVKSADEAEKVYKECVEKGVDWRTLLKEG